MFDVQNGTGEDAVLSLYDPAADETIRDVYVQARRSVRMKEIPEGTYQLAYTAGLDWDGGEAIFRCDGAIPNLTNLLHTRSTTLIFSAKIKDFGRLPILLSP